MSWHETRHRWQTETEVIGARSLVLVEITSFDRQEAARAFD